MLRKELKEKFLRELTASERIYFLKKAKESTVTRGYLPGEDLFWYCFSLTFKERLREIESRGSEAYLRVLLAEGTKDIEEAVMMYEGRLEKSRGTGPSLSGEEFILFLSE
jgi:hypothetical protein